MELERGTLRALEARLYDLELSLEEEESRDTQEELHAAVQRQRDLIDNQRKLFDDLEFQQLEVSEEEQE